MGAQAMTDADKRRRALELFNKFSTNPSVTNNDEISAAMLAFAAELAAAAIEECEKLARKLATDKQETEEAHHRYTPYPFNMQDFGFDPACVQLSEQIADSIAKLRESQ